MEFNQIIESDNKDIESHTAHHDSLSSFNTRMPTVCHRLRANVRNSKEQSNEKYQIHVKYEKKRLF